MKTFTPKIYNENNPTGFDREISAIQANLAGITFMEFIYGRANVQWRLLTDDMAANALHSPEGLRGRDKYTIYYPQGRKLGQDIDLSFDDSCASRCFFYLKDPINPSPKTDAQDWTSPNVEIAQPFSFIFSCNLQKLVNSTETPISSELVKTCVFNALNYPPKIVIGKTYEKLENVWSDFTMTQAIQGLCKYPFYCLRIDAVCTYMNNPFNGNDYFDPTTYYDISRKNTIPNSDAGNANLS